ncbi:hypothetical protein GOBAR_AA35649 [Gossypium barbadense]|uniref:SWIM-type domain-containing protein n=1 Tax=Gossypium barbadense TaxID=3634 RepID=A0A2P5W1Y2_GOSBA|nr:hypothetical protein GOBAR_AA35649 [Gossypium barbadense]
MAMKQLYGDFDVLYNEVQGWIASMREYVPGTVIELQTRPITARQQVNQMEAEHMFIENVRDTIVANRQMARSMDVEIYSRRLETFQVTETIGRRSSIPLRSYGVDLRNRRCDCRRFQTLHYPSAHVVAACAKVNLNVEQSVDDVLVPDKGLRRNSRCCPQSSIIRNEMDIREKFDGKHCGLCRLASHNQSKCPQRNYHVGQSSRSGRN